MPTYVCYDHRVLTINTDDIVYNSKYKEFITHINVLTLHLATEEPLHQDLWNLWGCVHIDPTHKMHNTLVNIIVGMSFLGDESFEDLHAMFGFESLLVILPEIECVVVYKYEDSTFGYIDIYREMPLCL